MAARRRAGRRPVPRLRRRLLGEIARVAARTVTAAIRTLAGERELAVGIVACVQTHGSRANWHPHLHLLVTDGGFRPDGTFVSCPAHDTTRLAEAFRRAVLRLFVRLRLFDDDQAAGMLTWPHSGFHVHTAVWVPEDDRAFATPDVGAATPQVSAAMPTVRIGCVRCRIIAEATSRAVVARPCA